MEPLSESAIAVAGWTKLPIVVKNISIIMPPQPKRKMTQHQNGQTSRTDEDQSGFILSGSLPVYAAHYTTGIYIPEQYK